MSELLQYLGKSGICLGILLLFFVILLQKETFLKLNRWILLANIILALMLPLLEKPFWFSTLNLANIEPSEVSAKSVEALPSSTMENIVPLINKKQNIHFNWNAILLIVYLIGFLIFLMRFLAQIFSILLLILANERERKDNILYVYPRKILAPFSFFGYLFIDKKAYDLSTFEQIIDHEKEHIRQRHSWDILLSEILIIIQWFNPFAWWHRQLVEINLEFLADKNLLENGVDPKTYQYNLLQLAVPNYPYSLATNYNSSLIKKRIMMMQQKKSSAAHSWKYFLLLPIFLLIWAAFGNPNSTILNTSFISIITADATEIDIRKAQEAYRKMGEALVINELKYNDQDRLSSINITSLSGNGGKCSSVIDEFEAYSYLYYKRKTKRSFQCGSILSDADFALISKTENWDFIFINGLRPTKESIDKLKSDTKKWRAASKEKIKKTSDKSEVNFGYREITEEKKAIIKERIAAAKTTTIYYLDGLKTDKTIDDFDYKNIRSVKLNQKMTNYYDDQGERLETLIDTLEVWIISQ